MHCDNQVAIFIVNNLTFHERTKYIEVDCYYVRDMVMKWVICTPYAQTIEKLAYAFTKGLSVGIFNSLCYKLGMINIYTSAWGGVLDIGY